MTDFTSALNFDKLRLRLEGEGGSLFNLPVCLFKHVIFGPKNTFAGHTKRFRIQKNVLHGCGQEYVSRDERARERMRVRFSDQTEAFDLENAVCVCVCVCGKMGFSVNACVFKKNNSKRTKSLSIIFFEHFSIKF